VEHGIQAFRKELTFHGRVTIYSQESHGIRIVLFRADRSSQIQRREQDGAMSRLQVSKAQGVLPFHGLLFLNRSG
jgi:hypothetical protein